jgi:nucleotide-binding universal stress UspA family protein
MKTIKRIVVGIDFSSYAQRIMEYGAGIAERNMAELIAVNVINKRQIDYIKTVCKDEDPNVFSLTKLINDETARRNHKMDDLIRQCVPTTVSTRPIIMVGVPFEEILDVVDNEHADVVVISSKGRTNFHDYIFGTTSEKIFRHCPVPVLSLNLRE